MIFRSQINVKSITIVMPKFAQISRQKVFQTNLVIVKPFIIAMVNFVRGSIHKNSFEKLMFLVAFYSCLLWLDNDAILGLQETFVSSKKN